MTSEEANKIISVIKEEHDNFIEASVMRSTHKSKNIIIVMRHKKRNLKFQSSCSTVTRSIIDAWLAII